MDFQTTILEIMTTDVCTVSPNTEVKDFKHLFTRRKFHHIPVEENGELVGIISTEDVNRSSRFFVSPDSLLAEHVMTPNPDTIQEDTTIVDAVQFFVEHQVRSLPVLNAAGKFVGMITPYDLMKEMLRSWQIREELRDMEDRV
jgi:CBS domain-containing protein